MASLKFLKGLQSNLPTAIVDGRVLFTTDQGHIYLEHGTERIELYKTDLDNIQTALNKINGNDTTNGSIAKAVTDAKTALIGLNSDTADSDTIKGAKKYADYLNTALKTIAKTGLAKDVAIEDSGNKLTASNLEDALTEIIDMIDAGGSGSVLTIDTTTTTDGYAKSYTLKQGDTTVGVIDIPKDMVLEDGEVVTNPEGQPAGTYIKLVLQNVTDPLFIDVSNLIEYVTSGSTSGDIVFITVDSTTHKITATITDGTITKAKLETSIQTSLGKADTALQADDIIVAETTGEYIAAVVKEDDGSISYTKKALPDISGLTWGDFTEVSGS